MQLTTPTEGFAKRTLREHNRSLRIGGVLKTQIRWDGLRSTRATWHGGADKKGSGPATFQVWSMKSHGPRCAKCDKKRFPGGIGKVLDVDEHGGDHAGKQATQL